MQQIFVSRNFGLKEYDTIQTMDEYGERLQQAMDAAKPPVTRTKLADGIGMTYQGVKKVLDLKGKLGTANHAKAAKLLKVSAEWLRTGKGSMEVSQITPPTTEHEKAVANLSQMALDMAFMFDDLTDRNQRAQAYNVATTEILRLLAETSAQPTGKPASTATPKTQRV